MLERREAHDRAEALALLGEWLPTGATEGFRRLEIDLPADEPLDIELYPKVHWTSRDDGLSIEAAGCALQAELDTWHSNGGLQAALEARVDAETARALRWFLWGRFDATTRPDPEWRAFGARRMLLPALEMRRTGDRRLLACNCNPQSLPALRDALQRATGGEPAAAPVEFEPGDSAPAEPEWCAQVDRVRALLERNDALQKVVLARRASWKVSGFDPVALLAAAAELQPATYRFMIQPDAGTAFLALSPEQLFRRVDRRIESEALAGTRPRGAGPESDDRLAAELLESTKDRREQRLVLDEIVAALEPLTSSVEYDERPELRRLREVQHLCNPVRGTLRDGVGDGDLMAALHPTPAVAGQPPVAARKVIAALESFDRGLYAGPVGCGSLERTEVAVAIRSALWTGDRLHLYAGAGLLPASDARAEWDETRDKMALLRRLLRHRSGKAVS